MGLPGGGVGGRVARIEATVTQAAPHRSAMTSNITHRFFTVSAFQRVAMLHSDHAIKAARMDVLEDVSIIDFSSARFLASGIVANLKIANFIPASFDVGNQIALGDLLVIDVEQDFA